MTNPGTKTFDLGRIKMEIKDVTRIEQRSRFTISNSISQGHFAETLAQLAFNFHHNDLKRFMSFHDCPMSRFLKGLEHKNCQFAGYQERIRGSEAMDPKSQVKQSCCQLYFIRDLAFYSII